MRATGASPGEPDPAGRGGPDPTFVAGAHPTATPDRHTQRVFRGLAGVGALTMGAALLVNYGYDPGNPGDISRPAATSSAPSTTTPRPDTTTPPPTSENPRSTETPGRIIPFTVSVETTVDNPNFSNAAMQHAVEQVKDRVLALHGTIRYIWGQGNASADWGANLNSLRDTDQGNLTLAHTRGVNGLKSFSSTAHSLHLDLPSPSHISLSDPKEHNIKDRQTRQDVIAAIHTYHTANSSSILAKYNHNPDQLPGDAKELFDGTIGTQRSITIGVGIQQDTAYSPHTSTSESAPSPHASASESSDSTTPEKTPDPSVSTTTTSPERSTPETGSPSSRQVAVAPPTPRWLDTKHPEAIPPLWRQVYQFQLEHPEHSGPGEVRFGRYQEWTLMLVAPLLAAFVGAARSSISNGLRSLASEKLGLLPGALTTRWGRGKGKHRKRPSRTA